MGCLRSCLGKIILLVLLIAAAFAGWLWGPAVFPRVEDWLSRTDDTPETLASPERAEAVMDRFELLRSGGVGDQMSLNSIDIVSVLHYSVPGILPDGFSNPVVGLADGSVTLTVQVVIETFPKLRDLGNVLGFLPDTITVSLEGTLTPLDERRAALIVHEIQASFIPLPDAVIPEILTAFGREYVGGLSDDALAIPLPSGIRSAHILRDRLVLVRDS